jgi:hypothetical protein
MEIEANNADQEAHEKLRAANPTVDPKALA